MSPDRAVVRRAVADALPLYVPAIPFAFVLGLAIVESEMNPWIGWLSSPIIFGGSAQLTLVTLLGTGTAAVAATIAALVVNGRLLMYSAALAPTFQRQPHWFRWLGPYLLIDQMFALSVLRTDDEPEVFRTYYVAAGATFWTLWLAVTAVGLFLGPVVPESWGLDFAVPILFIGLIVLGIDRWPKTVAAVVAAAVTFVLAGLPNRSGLLVGALMGVVAGTFAERLKSE